MTLTPVDGIVVGERPMVSHLLKGAYHSHPPQHRYSSTWNHCPNRPRVVFGVHPPPPHQLRSHAPKASTLYLAVILALTGAWRCCELQKLDGRFMTIFDKEITFDIQPLTKNQCVGYPTKEFFFAAYPQCPRLSMVEAVRQDCSRPKEFRSPSRLLLIL